ncbi:MAG: hypothetical protein JWO20_1122 [Candidatus Angelobacter sp.]|jgi:hypothetical protein|nr:hypothetical protein [Candidatus Angelobacter sp.]
MDSPNLPVTIPGSRRNEDIALDLMKFVTAHTDYSKTTAVGFQQAGGAKAQDQADKLLDLYTRCLHAVEGKHK